MYDKFTESARAAIKAASQEAMRVNHQYIGTDDILVGIALGEGGLAAQVIASHVDVAAIRQKLASMPRNDGGANTPRSKKIVEHAMNEARRLFHLQIGPEHLLLGVLHDTASDASRALSALGIDSDKLRSEIFSQLPPGSPEVIEEHRALKEQFANHPEVMVLEGKIARLQRELESAVASANFKLAAACRDDRIRIEESLLDLRRKLAQNG